MEARLRVEVKQESYDSVFYGNAYHTNVFEDVFHYEKDKRENIAPYGFEAKLTLENNSEMKISVDGGYLSYNEYSDGNDYYAFAHIDTNIYEIEVSFGLNGVISNILVSEWYDYSEFEDGSEPNKTYSLKDNKISEYKILK